jgi:hypothetical protein
MAHGTPLATGDADEQCGAAGPFLLEVGISSSYHIAKFFGLTRDRAHIASVQSGTTIATRAKASPEPEPLDGEVLDKHYRIPERAGIPPSSPLDIGAVITDALKAAGLMKDR